MAIPVEVRDGKLSYNRAWMDRVLARLQDGHYILDFINTKKRTSAQNAYYWGIILPLFAENVADGSYTKDEWHGLLTQKFLKSTMAVNGRVEETVRSTSRLTTKEFGIYMDQIIWYGREMFGIDIPEPQKYGM